MIKQGTMEINLHSLWSRDHWKSGIDNLLYNYMYSSLVSLVCQEGRKNIAAV